MDNNSNKLRGRGTLLFIMKRELAKSSGELLIGIYGVRLQAVEPPHCYGPRLDGKTLHIRSSFLEWTAIL